MALRKIVSFYRSVPSDGDLSVASLCVFFPMETPTYTGAFRRFYVMGSFDGDRLLMDEGTVLYKESHHKHHFRRINPEMVTVDVPELEVLAREFAGAYNQGSFRGEDPVSMNEVFMETHPEFSAFVMSPEVYAPDGSRTGRLGKSPVTLSVRPIVYYDNGTRTRWRSLGERIALSAIGDALPLNDSNGRVLGYVKLPTEVRRAALPQEILAGTLPRAVAKSRYLPRGVVKGI